MTAYGKLELPVVWGQPEKVTLLICPLCHVLITRTHCAEHEQWHEELKGAVEKA